MIPAAARKPWFPSLYPPPGEAIAPARRFLAVTLTVWPMLGLYILINRHSFAHPITVLMPGWVPFWPPMLVVYQGMLLVTWLLPVAIRDARLFRACLRADVFAYLLIMPWWIITPTQLPRPPLPDGAWENAFRLLWGFDQPTNVLPCAHGVGPVVAAWFVGRIRPAWRWPLLGLVLLGLPSIALTWQHRPVDIVLGIVAAAVGIFVGEMWESWRFP